jgi:gliding motility-associated-like protein
MFLRIAAISLVLASFYNGTAQVVSNGGRFTIPHEKACAPYGANGEIMISVPECDGSIACAIDFKYDPAAPFTDPPGEDNIDLVENGTPVNYTYTEPGNYIIAIKFGAGGTIDEVPFTVLPGTPPDFNIYTCSGNRVQLEILSTDFPSYTIDYNNDNNPETTSASGVVSPPHTYGSTAQQTISVRPDYLNCIAATKTVTPVGPFPSNHAVTNLEVTEADPIDLDFVLDDNILYQVDRNENGGPFTSIGNVINTNIFTDANVNPDQNFYCYRIGSINICDSPTPNFSNTVCSTVIDLDVQDGQNQMDWQTNTNGAFQFTLTRIPGTQINLPLTSSGYTDTQVSCGTNYCYQLVLDYGGNIRSGSKIVCGTAISSAIPDAVDEIGSVVNGNSVKLDWVENPDYTVLGYTLFRKPTHVTVPFSNVSTTTYTDETYLPFQNYCYEVRFDDVCKNRSARSQPVCPIELQAILQENNDVQLTWTAYEGYSSGVDHYAIEKYNASGALVETFDISGTTTFMDQAQADGQTFTYRVLAFSTSPTSPQPSISNTQSIVKNLRLYHPTAFVPNSENPENRIFFVRGIPEYISSFELKIFNRWGEMVFFSTDMDRGWDGSFKGIKMPEGTYVFRTQIKDTAGRTFDYSGSLVLLKR